MEHDASMGVIHRLTIVGSARRRLLPGLADYQLINKPIDCQVLMNMFLYIFRLAIDHW